MDTSEKLASQTVYSAHSLTGRDVETHQIRLQDADEAAKFVAGFDRVVTEEESRRVKRKIDLHLMPLLMAVYFVQFLDKTTLGASSILGLIEDNSLSKNQYNWLGTIFYLAYLVFEWPQNLGLQRFPPAKWMAGNILIWAVVLCTTAAASNFAGLFICRLLMGACEGTITAGFMILTSMFYTHAETMPRYSYWSLMNAVASIVSGLLSFGVYHVDEKVIAPWKLFFIITGGITLFVGFCFWYFVPDNPMKASFLTKEEKLIAIARLRNQSTGVENKTWKREQFIEALTDWKVWAFAIYGAVSNISNSMGNMTGLIIESFGFTTEQTTLLNCVNGVMEGVAILSAVWLFKKYPNSRAYLGAWYALPNIVSGILLVALPWSAQGALLFAMYISFWGGPDFIFAMAWLMATTAGHTKKTTANAMLFIGYCLGNLLSPQMWRGKYAPRYYLPWGIILGTYVARPIMLLVMRYYMVKENQRRDALGHDKVEKFFDEHGQEVDPTFLDITDKENMAFRYQL
ncbi:uncharacterized protein MYCFIDRAFT_40591 [Pseudocercospora fijiensis CIRAD86]|uniref:Major facilitator superfamily (MFS) profile domain-containing protein n=1 Tax=Pseudocercospora fijiensis (strain CIRAD86) TaxID=383855 RepID=M2ZTX0_PSEFD|nr:uncharacterized protein MYCFIDRAFT_40591 [Pseudocercospora fijiensis CIRAD86]EME82449.1 hypothetical protein MYCFIDRAFT_40591 [Pseudocercospora fijiensis CIRAD86]